MSQITRSSGKRFLTVGEAAEICRVCRDTIRAEIERGHLAATRIGLRRIVIQREELERYIETRTPNPNGASNITSEIIDEAGQICQEKRVGGRGVR